MDNLLLTPLMGYVTAEDLGRLYTDAAKDIAAYLDGQPIRELV